MTLDRVRLLRHSSFFAVLSDEELAELAALAQFRSVEARKVVCWQGSPGEEMFTIAKGRLKVGAASSDGREAIFDILGEGDCFGEVSLIDGLGRSATVTAVEASEILVLRREHFLAFLESHPRIAVKLLGVLCQRLRAADGLLEDIHFLNLGDRLFKALNTLARRHGREVPQGVAIDVRVSQEELGHLVGASRESVNKQLKALEQQGKLLLWQGSIVLPAAQGPD